jgi:hypothetical protein
MQKPYVLIEGKIVTGIDDLLKASAETLDDPSMWSRHPITGES